MGHLSVNLAILRRNEQEGEGVDHESVDFIHTVLEIQWLFRLVHESIMEYNCLKYCPRLQLQLLASLDQPLNQHLAHLKGEMNRLALFVSLVV